MTTEERPKTAKELLDIDKPELTVDDAVKYAEQEVFSDEMLLNQIHKLRIALENAATRIRTRKADNDKLFRVNMTQWFINLHGVPPSREDELR